MGQNSAAEGENQMWLTTLSEETVIDANKS